MIIKIPKQHQLGKEYFRLPDMETLYGNKYFDCIDFLRPLFRESNFKKYTPGFYLNFITNRVEDGDDGKNSVRLTYFTINPIKTFEAIENFNKSNKNKIRIYESRTKERPIGKGLINFDENQNRFWQFLNDYTQIGLDLLENYGRESSQKIIREYRFYHLLQRKSPEPFLGPIFFKNSQYFRELKKYSLDKEFWKNLTYYFGNSNFGLHFLVNMMGLKEEPYYYKIFEKDWIAS